MMWSPSSKEYLGRSPKGTAMLAGLTGKHIARTGRLGSGPALGPRNAVGEMGQLI
jgi:hypothetical protein